MRTFLAGILIAVSLAYPASALAAGFNPFGAVCGSNTPSNPTCTDSQKQVKSGNDPVITEIQDAANIIAVIAGIGAIIMIIVSGLMFVTAGGATPGQRSGDPNRIKSAKQALTAALAGLFIIALAWTITRFITDRLIQ